MSAYLARALSSRAITAAGVRDVPAAGDGDQGALRQVGGGLAVLPRAHVVAGVDGGRGQLAGLAGVTAAPGPPDVAGVGAVGPGGFVAHPLERVAAVGEALRPVGETLQLERLDLGAVLGLLEVAQVGHQLVGGAVEAAGLGVEHVDVAPQQALALVGELGSFGAGAPAE